MLDFSFELKVYEVPGGGISVLSKFSNKIIEDHVYFKNEHAVNKHIEFLIGEIQKTNFTLSKKIV